MRQTFTADNKKKCGWADCSSAFLLLVVADATLSQEILTPTQFYKYVDYQ